MRNLSLLALNLASVFGRHDSVFTFTKSIKVALVGDDMLHKVPLFHEFQANSDYEEIEVYNFALENSSVIRSDQTEFYTESLNYKELVATKPDVIVVMFGTRDSQKAIWIEEQFRNDYS